jgi:hypothetical protein
MDSSTTYATELSLSKQDELIKPAEAKAPVAAVESGFYRTSVADASKYVLDLIHADELSPEMQDQIMRETLDTWYVLLRVVIACVGRE